MTGPHHGEDRRLAPVSSTPAGPPFTTLQRVLVIGAGRSGLAATRLLRDAGVAVRVLERDPQHPGLDDLADAGAHAVTGEPTAASVLEEIDVVVASPGVAPSHPVLVAAADAATPIWSEPELAWRAVPRRLLAVTGTNGKTTTTRLLTDMIAAADLPVVACGNIGRAMSQATLEEPATTTFVVEMSSFQLHYCSSLRPEIGILVNLADDHLDWHGSAEAYAAAKGTLWRFQQRDDWAIVNLDDPAALAVRTAHATSQRAGFTRRSADVADDLASPRLTGDLDDEASVVTVGPAGIAVIDSARALKDRRVRVLALGGAEGQADPPHAARPLTLVSADAVALRTRYEVDNIAAAAAAAWRFGVAHCAINHAAHRFITGEHRGRVVAEHGDVRWIDDSKATNPHAAAASLRTHERVVWIAGGLAKGADLTVLTDALATVRVALLIGTAAPQLAAVCEAAGVTAHVVDDLEHAVDRAAEEVLPGEVVLLAPACASFDQFRDYEDRGRQFAQAAVRRLAQRRAG